MSTYDLKTIDIPSGLDELGYRLGLSRLEFETSADYRRRLMVIARNPPRPDEMWYRSHLSALLGLQSLNVFDIDLVLDGDGEPTAPDARVEITATRMVLWEDYENSVVDVEIDLVNAHKWLTDVHAAITASTHFTVNSLDADYDYYHSKNLRVADSLAWSDGELFSGRKVHKFKHPYLVAIYPEGQGNFENEVASMSLVADYGDYYVNYTSGVTHTYSPSSGLVKYSYRDFPFRVWWDAARVVSMVDQDITALTRNRERSNTTGLDVPGGTPNDFGAAVYNHLLSLYPLGWGE